MNQEKKDQNSGVPAKIRRNSSNGVELENTECRIIFKRPKKVKNQFELVRKGPIEG